jgi:hypothetical protein
VHFILLGANQVQCSVCSPLRLVKSWELPSVLLTSALLTIPLTESQLLAADSLFLQISLQLAHSLPASTTGQQYCGSTDELWPGKKIRGQVSP